MCYTTGSITYEFEAETFNYDRGIKLLANVMDMEEAGVLDRFAAAGSKLQRAQVAPEADAFAFPKIAGRDGAASAESALACPHATTNAIGRAEQRDQPSCARRE